MSRTRPTQNYFPALPVRLLDFCGLTVDRNTNFEHIINYDILACLLPAFCFNVRFTRSHRRIFTHSLRSFSSLFIPCTYPHHSLLGLRFKTHPLTYHQERMDDSPRPLRNRIVGRNTSASYRDLLNPIQQSLFPLLSTSSSPTKTPPPPPRRYAHRPRLSLSPPKRVQRRSSPVHSADRFIPNASLSPQQPSLQEILSSPPTKPVRDGSQSPTNPQLHSPGKPEWPNSFDDTIHSYRLATALEIPISPKLLHFHSWPSSPIHKSPPPPASQATFLAVEQLDPPELVRRQLRKRSVPPDPFRILDAPELRDDYYAQPLSWSITRTIAVALGMDVFLWDPTLGVNQLPTSTVEEVTSLAFSPTGEILAIAHD